MSQNWIEKADRLFTAVVLDALDGIGLKNQSPDCPILPQTLRKPVIGIAKPLLWIDFAYEDPGTYDLELKAVDAIRPNEVVVCATSQSRRSGIWGELLTTAAMTRGARGVVTDGTVRDVDRMTEMEFPVYACGTCAYDSWNRQKVVDYDVAIEIGGVKVQPGDIIIADVDGVAVVPVAAADDVLAAALEKVENENDFRRAVKAGMPLAEAYSKFQIL